IPLVISDTILILKCTALLHYSSLRRAEEIQRPIRVHEATHVVRHLFKGLAGVIVLHPELVASRIIYIRYYPPIRELYSPHLTKHIVMNAVDALVLVCRKFSVGVVRIFCCQVSIVLEIASTDSYADRVFHFRNLIALCAAVGIREVIHRFLHVINSQPRQRVLSVISLQGLYVTVVIVRYRFVDHTGFFCPRRAVIHLGSGSQQPVRLVVTILIASLVSRPDAVTRTFPFNRTEVTLVICVIAHAWLCLRIKEFHSEKVARVVIG